MIHVHMHGVLPVNVEDVHMDVQDSGMDVGYWWHRFQ